MMAMYGYDKQPAEEEPVDDGDDDFYGLDAIAQAARIPGKDEARLSNKKHENNSLVTMSSEQQQTSRELAYAAQHAASLPQLMRTIEQPMQPRKPSEEKQRMDNEKKAADLRAKLIAERLQRQNTPNKTPSLAKGVQKTMAHLQCEKAVLETQEQASRPGRSDGSGDTFGLESLLAEGKAAAEAKINEGAATAARQKQTYTPVNGAQSLPLPQNAESDHAEPNKPAEPDPSMVLSERPNSATDLTDPYYSDLPLWLEVTGYHNTEYRNSKLAMHKERKSLEQEAARIAERLQLLRQAEQADLASLRSAAAQYSPANHPPPSPLPTVMPSAGALQHTPMPKPSVPAPTTNGVKRARSPEPMHVQKVARYRADPADYHPEGGKGTTYNSANHSRHARTPSPTGLERRISYPELRSWPAEEYEGSRSHRSYLRDPSLERRQRFYRLNGGSDAGSPPSHRFGTLKSAQQEDRLGRTGYSSVNGPPTGATPYDFRQQYRSNADLDLKKDGVRYFLIKSWNHQNVETAMRDGLWATQQKNEQMLTEAYKTSRHVILLFSVNKSTQFQGYALMTSPPDPSLPTPTFCAKLHWKTSPAFTLRWLGKTAVHFRHVGHLKNRLNLDEDHRPMAVLVGKDGQEISPEAGLGLVEILDDMEVTEGHVH